MLLPKDSKSMGTAPMQINGKNAKPRKMKDVPNGAFGLLNV